MFFGQNSKFLIDLQKKAECRIVALHREESFEGSTMKSDKDFELHTLLKISNGSKIQTCF